METLTKISKTNNWFEKQASQFEEARFAAMTMMLTVQSCIGSIAGAYSANNEGVESLLICSAVTMGANAAFIAQAPAKWCLSIFYTSLIINIAIIIVNLIK